MIGGLSKHYGVPSFGRERARNPAVTESQRWEDGFCTMLGVGRSRKARHILQCARMGRRKLTMAPVRSDGRSPGLDSLEVGGGRDGLVSQHLGRGR